MARSHHMVVILSAQSSETLWSAIVTLALALPDPDMVAAIRMDEVACFAEIDV